MYDRLVPKLWKETIEGHRREVREAILNTAAGLVAEHGLRAVTMSQIAEQTGIGRATLYKYFPDVEAVLVAWHHRQVTGHLEDLAERRDRAGDAGQQLEAVLEAYAHIQHRADGHDAELVAFLHRDDRAAPARHQLTDMIRVLLSEGVGAGHVRDDVPPDELARFCVHALGASRGLQSKAAVRRLVTVILAALQKQGRG